MARQPDGDERLVLPACPGGGQERVFVMDLVRYLGCRANDLVAFARRHRLLLYKGRGGSYSSVPCLTKYGAMRVIAHFRALEGAVYLQGRDFHAERASAIAATRRWYAKKLARQAILDSQRALVVALPPSETGRLDADTPVAVSGPMRGTTRT